MYCEPGRYLPAGSNECSDCQERCGPTKYWTDTLPVCQSCADYELGNMPCGYAFEGTQGLFCPGKCLKVDSGKHQGLERCPLEFPDIESPSQEDDSKCSTTFEFYPGAGATFRGENFTYNNEYIEEKMYHRADSDVFEYGEGTHSGSWHILKATFVTGDDRPSKPNYIFKQWVLPNGTLINETSHPHIMSSTDYRDRVIRAEWEYTVQYDFGPGENHSKHFHVESGEKHRVEANTALAAYSPITNQPTGGKLIKEGHIVVGWCVNEQDCADSELLHPGKYICDVNKDGVTKVVTPKVDGEVILYAKFKECDAANNRVADTSTNKCVCATGYYGSETTGCTKCGNGMTTKGIGTTSSDGCKHFFRYKVGDDYKTWNWPTDKLDLGDITNVSGLP